MLSQFIPRQYNRCYAKLHIIQSTFIIVAEDFADFASGG